MMAKVLKLTAGAICIGGALTVSRALASIAMGEPLNGGDIIALSASGVLYIISMVRLAYRVVLK